MGFHRDRGNRARGLTVLLLAAMSSGSGLPPGQHGAFAIISRLLSCLVTEKLLRGVYIPIANSPSLAGVLVVLSTRLTSEEPFIGHLLCPSNVFAIAPLRHAPVFSSDDKNHEERRHGRSVGLVDPLDMLPEIYELSETVHDTPECVCFCSFLLSFSLVVLIWDHHVSFRTLSYPVSFGLCGTLVDLLIW